MRKFSRPLSAVGLPTESATSPLAHLLSTQEEQPLISPQEAARSAVQNVFFVFFEISLQIRSFSYIVRQGYPVALYFTPLELGPCQEGDLYEDATAWKPPLGLEGNFSLILRYTMF